MAGSDPDRLAEYPDTGRRLGTDPYGRAIREYHHGEQTDPLYDVDGGQRRDHPIAEYYFGRFRAESDAGAWLAAQLSGPLLDLGAGAGRHALYFQEQFETVAVDRSAHLVDLLCDRGVEDARQVSMFSLREAFGCDRFRSVLSVGTQLCLAGSMQGLRRLLCDLAYVTTADGRVVVDSYDPSVAATADTFGFRPDPTPGLAYRVYHYEYGEDVGPELLFRLFSPDRLREAAAGTGWQVSVRRHSPSGGSQYRAVLRKRGTG